MECVFLARQANSLSHKFVKSASECEHKICLHELDVHVGFCRNECSGSACFANSIVDVDLGCPSAHRAHHGSSQTCRTCCPTSNGCCPDRCPTSHYRDHDLVPVLKRHLLTTSSTEQQPLRSASQIYAYFCSFVDPDPWGLVRVCVNQYARWS